MAVESILVVAEPGDGTLTTASLELLGAARSLASRVDALTWGAGAACAAQAGEHGATTLFNAGDLGGALPGAPVGAAAAALAPGYDAVLIPSSYDGRDVAGRLSARLDRPVLTNVTGLADEGGLVTEHPVFGGTLVVRARFTGERPGIVVVRAKSFAAEPSGGAPAAVQAAPSVDAGPGALARVVASHVEERVGPKLEDAAVVVSGGRGLGEAGRYALIEEVARLLGGAAGASRAIVDAGWVPYSHQVGQTGKTVKPTVYLAFGISGATQHLVGMKGSRSIVAVNKDPEAPIFQVADLGIVGDATTILPALIEALQSRA